MEKNNLPTNSNDNLSLIRVDKNLSSDPLNFSIFSNPIMAMDIILYCLKSTQKNIFGTKDFALKDFCNEFNYDKSNMMAKLSPKDRISDKTGEWNNIFDKTVKELIYRNLAFTQGYIKDGKKVSVLKGIQLVHEAHKYQDIKNKNKIHYSIKINPVLEYQLTHYFSEVNLNVLPKLRRKRLYFAYTYLVTLKQALFFKGNESTILFFPFLCNKLFDINMQEPKYLKRKIKAKFEELQKHTDLNFEFEFVKSKESHRWNYDVLVKFNEFEKSQYLEYSKEKSKESIFIEYKKLLSEFYQYKYPSYKDESMFIEWIDKYKDGSLRDSKEKIKFLGDVYAKRNLKIPSINVFLEDFKKYCIKNLK